MRILHSPLAATAGRHWRMVAVSAAALAVGLTLGLAGFARPASAQDGAVYGPVAGPDSSAGAPAVVPPAVPAPLAETVARALADNPQVLARRAALAVGEADLDAARWLRYPSLSAEALAATRGSNVADSDGLALNVALEQPLWAGGAIDGQIDAARAARDAGANSVREVRQSIMLGVIDGYFAALDADRRAVALRAGIADHRKLVASIERRVTQEVSPLADLTLARSRTTQLEIELTASEETAARARLRLAELAGSVPETLVLPGPDIFALVPPEAAAEEEMLACAPLLDRLTNQIAAAEAEKRAARGQLLPRLLLQLSQNEITGARAALVLRAQTGSGLSRFSAIDRAEARIDEATAQRSGAQREIAARLGNAFVAMESNIQQTRNAALATDAAADLVASYERQFVAGRRSWLDVMNAARELTNARITEGSAAVNAAANAARILALTCRWSPTGAAQ